MLSSMQPRGANVKVCYINIEMLSRERLFKSRNGWRSGRRSAPTQGRFDQRLGAAIEDGGGIVAMRRVEMPGERQHGGAMRQGPDLEGEAARIARIATGRGDDPGGGAAQSLESLVGHGEGRRPTQVLGAVEHSRIE